MYLCSRRSSSAIQPLNAVSIRQRGELVEYPLRRFAAKAHGVAVESAEGAVMQERPTNSRARSRLGKFDFKPPLTKTATRLDRWKIIDYSPAAAARHDCGRTIRLGSRGRSIRPCCRIPSGGRVPVGPARSSQSQELRKRFIAFARADEVDPGNESNHLQAHFAFAIRPSKDDKRGGVGELPSVVCAIKKACASLVKRGRKADNRRLVPENLFRALIGESCALTARRTDAGNRGRGPHSGPGSSPSTRAQAEANRGTRRRRRTIPRSAFRSADPPI